VWHVAAEGERIARFEQSPLEARTRAVREPFPAASDNLLSVLPGGLVRLKFPSALDPARSRTGIRGAVTERLKRPREAGLGWPLDADLDDSVLEAVLFIEPCIYALRSSPVVQRQPPRRLRRHPSFERRGDTPLLSEEGCRRSRRDGVEVCNLILQGSIEAKVHPSRVRGDPQLAPEQSAQLSQADRIAPRRQQIVGRT